MNVPELDWIWYTPKWNGNREDPEPMEVEVRTPGFGYTRAMGQRAGLPAEQRRDMDRGLFLEHIRGVRRFTLAGKPVTTGADLWRLGCEENRIEPELYIELFKVLDDQAKLREGVAQGLPGPSGSA